MLMRYTGTCTRINERQIHLYQSGIDHLHEKPVKFSIPKLSILYVAGAHCIQMTVADIEIVGSPFVCEVYDASRVEVNIQPRAVVGKPYDFEGMVLLDEIFFVQRTSEEE